jgi:nucleoside-diphosphate-sugar epimerase
MNSTDNILVTGASGLLGNELVLQLLSAGKKVKAVYHKTLLDQINHVNLEKVPCDLLDVIALEEIMENITHVYHCAGLVNFSSRYKNKLYKINVEATANVVNASLSAGVQKFVHVSSVAALDRMSTVKPINEDMQWTKETGGSVYGHSKYLGELEVWRGIAEGLNAVIINPTIILGAGNWNIGSTAIFKKVYDGLKWYTDGSTGFVDVKDVCRAMIVLMESDIQSERFIISAENKQFKEVLFMIADAFNIERPSKKVNNFISAMAWRLEGIRSYISGNEPLITKETANAALAKVSFNNSKFLYKFPDFQYKSLGETIKDTCAILQQKLNND